MWNSSITNFFFFKSNVPTTFMTYGKKRKRETMPIRVLWTCSLYPYAFVPNVFSFCLIIPSPFSIAQMNKDKSKSSEKTATKEENEARELISNVSLKEHWKLRCVNSQFSTMTCTNVCGEVHYISKLIEKWNILLLSMVLFKFLFLRRKSGLALYRMGFKLPFCHC